MPHASRGRAPKFVADARRAMHVTAYSPARKARAPASKRRGMLINRMLLVGAALGFVWVGVSVFRPHRRARRSRIILPPPLTARRARRPVRIPMLFRLEQAERVQVLRVPARWNRYHLPWFQPRVQMPLTLRAADRRIIYAPTKRAMSDGLGHSMTALNYELLVALRLGVAYSHRVSSYSSLTHFSPNAVETFFGWGDGHIRREDVRADCEPQAGAWPAKGTREDDAKCNVCSHRTTGNGRFGFRQIVDVPEDIAHHCAGKHKGAGSCENAIDEFLSQHNDSRTIFQLPPEFCRQPTSDSDLNLSKGFFFAHYWRRHARRGSFARRRLRSRRHLKIEEGVMNIAVHVRRGDFLTPEVRKKRGVLADATFAQVLVDILTIVGARGGPLARMRPVVHIFSEGSVPRAGYSSHATELQTKEYFDSDGVPRDAGWWKELLATTQPRASVLDAIDGDPRPVPAVDVRMHISEDTLASLHEMIAADIFVGSRSGLSNQLVWALSRGVSAVPMSNTNGIELGRIGKVCCSVPFDHDSGKFDAARFARYWEAYTIANDDSAERALRESTVERPPPAEAAGEDERPAVDGTVGEEEEERVAAGNER